MIMMKEFKKKKERKTYLIRSMRRGIKEGYDVAISV